jgi:ATPase subunit of ABC transporter with duplicated ATPase domains
VRDDCRVDRLVEALAAYRGGLLVVSHDVGPAGAARDEVGWGV